jgi:gluconate 5-dehydrogenase
MSQPLTAPNPLVNPLVNPPVNPLVNPLFDLTGKTALITGSSRGIGKALAEGLARAGARIILNGRDATALAATQSGFTAAGFEAHTSAFDVTDEGAVSTAIDEIEANIGAIDILVNNTGIQIRGPLEHFSSSDFNRIVQTNLTSVFLVSKAVVQGMIRRRAGKIVNVLSVNAMAARYSIAPYSATKGALNMLTKGMCVDWARYNIQINGLAPGYFETELTRLLVADAEFTSWIEKRVPTGRWGQVAELAGAAVFLASPAANFVNGHVLYVDGGMTAGL